MTVDIVPVTRREAPTSKLGQRIYADLIGLNRSARSNLIDQGLYALLCKLADRAAGRRLAYPLNTYEYYHPENRGITTVCEIYVKSKGREEKLADVLLHGLALSF